MPFGLVNATSTFQRLMDRVLEGMHEFSSAYVDDILIYSPDWASHLGHIESVMQRLKEAGLTAKVAKCEWAKTQLVYLGHRIGHGRIAVPEDRATAIAEFIKPTTKKGVRAFLGTTGYYRKFIPDFGKVAKPLTMLTRKTEPDQVHWTLEGEQAFIKLRKLLCHACALTIPTLSDSFRLHTDASGAGLGAVLSVIRKGEEHPVAYFSRQPQGAEINYASTELECLAVVAAIRHFEVYLAGRQFELVTDNQALKGLRTSRNHNRRLTRWFLFLQDFMFKTRYRPGELNSNADGLSRQCWPEQKVPQAEGTASSKGEGRVADRHRHFRQPLPLGTLNWLSDVTLS